MSQPEVFTIKDDRTVFCRAAMRAHNGVWNPQLGLWMFQDGADAANAMSILYFSTRPTAKQCEALRTMIEDGIGALAWNYDPSKTYIQVETLDRQRASKMLAAGYAVRKMLGVDTLEDREPQIEDDTFDASAFEDQVHSSRRGRKRAA